MTRLYLPSSGSTPPISPTPHAEWDNIGSVYRSLMPLSRGTTALTNFELTDPSTTLNLDVLLGQFLYALPTGIPFKTTDTVWGQVRCYESAAQANFRTQYIARVLDSAGTTVRAVLCGPDLSTGSANPTSEWSQSFAENRFQPRGAPLPLLVNYTSVAGDWLVIELGFRKHSTTNTNLGRNQYGDDNTLLELPIDEAATTARTPWLEFSTDLVTAPTVARRRMAVIS